MGFWSKEGGYVDNVLGPTLMGDDDQCGHRRGEPELLSSRPAAASSGLWTINPKWNLLATGIYQRSDTDGHWDTDPFLGDNKITRFFDDWRDDKWYTTVGDAEGRPRLRRALA